MEEHIKTSVGTIVRTIALAVALVNQLLVCRGIQPIPIGEEEIYALVSTITTVVVAIWTWWKNNSFTKEAQAADVYLRAAKEDR